MADQVYWNNVKQGANFLFGTKSTPRRSSSGQKKVSVWEDRYSTDKEKLNALRAKRNRCDSKWNAFKNFFGFGEKMTSREIDTYYKLETEERERQVFDKENKDFYQEFMPERAGQWE